MIVLFICMQCTRDIVRKKAKWLKRIVTDEMELSIKFLPAGLGTTMSCALLVISWTELWLLTFTTGILGASSWVQFFKRKLRFGTAPFACVHTSLLAKLL